MERQPGVPLSTFVVRFWQGCGTSAPRWHGHARHIQSGEQVSFADEATLAEFLRRWVTMPDGWANPLGEEGFFPLDNLPGLV